MLKTTLTLILMTLFPLIAAASDYSQAQWSNLSDAGWEKIYDQQLQAPILHLNTPVSNKPKSKKKRKRSKKRKAVALSTTGVKIQYTF